MTIVLVLQRLNTKVVNILKRRPVLFLLTSFLSSILIVNAWTLIPRPYAKSQSQEEGYPEYWSFLFVVFTPYAFGTSALIGSVCYAVHGDAWVTEQGLRPLVEMAPTTIVPLVLGCLIYVFPDEIRLPLIRSKIWWPASLLTGAALTFAFYVWNARTAILRGRESLKGDVAKGFMTGPIPHEILKTANEIQDEGVAAARPNATELNLYSAQRAMLTAFCMSVSCCCYLSGQIFSHFYFRYAPYNFVMEIALIEFFKIGIKVTSFINICIANAFIRSEVLSAILYYFSELAFYIFYRNLFTSKMNSAWTVIGLCVLNAGMYGLLPVIFMSRWGFQNLQIPQLLRISTEDNEDIRYPAYVRVVARKMIVNALATVVSMVSFFVWSLGTRYISNEVHFMTYGRTHQDDETFYAIMNKSAGALASEVFAISLGIWWAQKFHGCNPIKEFFDWLIENPSSYYCFMATTNHVLGDLVIALISVNFL